MPSQKAAEAALPRSTIPAFRPFAKLLDRITTGHLRIRIGDGIHDLFGDEPGPSAVLQVHRPLSMARRIATNGHVGLGEAYMAGDWDSPDLTAFIHLLAVNEENLLALETGSWLHRIGSLLHHRSRRNSRAGSRRNISFHYDLGNAFYRLWLDPSMTYSAAIFDEGDDLGQAQHRKYRRLLGMLAPESGSHILEIGCGWGGLARTAAEAGHRVTGITLSSEQLAWARSTLDHTPFADAVELRLQDYRDLDEQFDHIVSIEMFEAVGEAYWPTYMETLCHCLRPGGRAVLQIITIDEKLFAPYKSSPDFIQHYVFPGGMLPTVSRFDQAATDAGLRVRDRSFHGLDYARTLAIWHERFLAQLDAIRDQGFDERFIRMWRYYLSYCEAGFLDRRIDVMQVVLERPGL